MTGVTTNVCVGRRRARVIFLDHYIVFVGDCTGTTSEDRKDLSSEEIHRWTLTNIELTFGVVVTSGDVISAWRKLVFFPPLEPWRVGARTARCSNEDVNDPPPQEAILPAGLPEPMGYSACRQSGRFPVSIRPDGDRFPSMASFPKRASSQGGRWTCTRSSSRPGTSTRR